MNMEFLEPLLARLRLIVGRCVITATKYKDGEMLSDIGLVADEKRRNVEIMQQYGFSSRPKGDIDGVAIFVGGSRENGVVIATRGDCPELNPGEVKVHSPFGSSVFLKEDGTVEIESSGDVVVNTGKSIGKLVVNGGIEATMDVKAYNNTTKPVSLAMHTHTSAAGPTNPPTPTG